MADIRTKRLAERIAPLRVTPGKRVILARDFDPGFKADFVKKKDAAQRLQEGVQLLSEYQDRLAAQDNHGVVVILQALDAAGKDGTIRHVMSGVNPQGVKVHSFKAPSAEELDHDYLWRFAKNLPARGEIGIFNRSYYEEVLVVRVHPEILAGQKLPRAARGRDIWKRRYRDINDWERYLTDNGFKIVKLFLNLSQEEQRARFLRRIDLEDHNWKFSSSDVQERACWDAYQQAFSAMLSATSTEWAPWYVIPADHKWFARLCAAGVIADALIDIDPRYPKVTPEKRAELQQVREDLEAQAPEGAAPDPFAAELAAKLAKKMAGAGRTGRDAAGKGDADKAQASKSKGGKAEATDKPGKKLRKAEKKAAELKRAAEKAARKAAAQEAKVARLSAPAAGTAGAADAASEAEA